MHDEKMKQTLENAFPETPAIFHQQLEETVRFCRKKQEKRRMRPAFRFALCCLAALMICGGAIAAMNHYGVLNFDPGWDDSYYFTLPQAQNMIQYDLAQEHTGDLLWQVKEAIYDGRILSILYSFRDTAAKQPVAQDHMEEAIDSLASQWGVYLKCDGDGEILVNGKGVNLNSVQYRPGEENGEVECWVDCRMEYYDEESGEYLRIAPEGTLTIEMPFAYVREKTETDPDALCFALSAGDAATRYSLVLPDSVSLSTGCSFAFTDLHFSPAAVFMDFEITLSPERAKAITAVDKTDYNAYDAALKTIPEYTAAWYAHLENSRGETLGMEKDGWFRDSLEPDGSLLLHWHKEFTPSDQYTDTIFLCLDDQARIEIPMRYVSDSQ